MEVGRFLTLVLIQEVSHYAGSSGLSVVATSFLTD